ncbi:hypothetical protein PRBEI_2000790100 [Prionailurus iriomotensis]
MRGRCWLPSLVRDSFSAFQAAPRLAPLDIRAPLVL